MSDKKLVTMAQLRAEKRAKHYGMTLDCLKALALEHFLQQTEQLPEIILERGTITLEAAPENFWQAWPGRN